MSMDPNFVGPTLSPEALAELQDRLAREAARRSSPLGDLTRRNYPGFLSTLTTGWHNPGQVLQGSTLNTLYNLPKAFGGMLARSAQGLSELTSAPSEIYPPDAPQPPASAESILNSGVAALNPATFGLLQNTIDAANRRDASGSIGPFPTFEDHLKSGAMAVGETIAKDLLPGQEFIDFARGAKTVGYDKQGAPVTMPLTGEDIGERISSSLLKTLFVGGLFGRVKAAPLVDEINPTKIKKTLSSQEIQDFKVLTPEEVQATTDVSKPAAPPPPIDEGPVGPVAAALDAGLGPDDTHIKVLQYLDTPALAKVLNDTVKTDAFRTIVERAPDDTHLFKNVGTFVRENNLPETLIRDIVRDYDSPLSVLSTTLADIMENASSQSGKILQKYSDAVQITHNLLLDEALRPGAPAEARYYLSNFQKTIPKEDLSQLSMWDRFATKANKLETGRRFAMVGAIQTAMRNVVSQGFTSIVNLFEETLAGSLQYYEGIKVENGKLQATIPASQAMAGVVGYIALPVSEAARTVAGALGRLPFGETYARGMGKMMDIFSRPFGASITDVMDQLPLTKSRLYGNDSIDLATGYMNSLDGVINDTLNKVSRGLAGSGEFLEGLTNTMMLANRTQEVLYRRLGFSARLWSNIKQLGYKDFDEVMSELRSPNMSPDLRAAVINAEEHALKNTYATTPYEGFGKMVLNTQKAMAPLFTMLVHPFPRFMVNQLLWQIERAPHHIFDAFSPEVSEALHAGANNGFASITAARQVTKGISSLMLLNSAWIIRNSPLGGPKFYDVAANMDPTNKFATSEGSAGKYRNVQSLQPYVTYLGMAELLKAARDGSHPNISISEMVDLAFGVQRLSNNMVLGAADFIRSIESTNFDVTWKAVASPLGNWAASFLTPMSTLRDMYAVYDKDFTKSRDFYGSELTGPARDRLQPILGKGIAADMPFRQDISKGEPIQAEDPLSRQLLGLTTKSYNHLGALIASTPGINSTELSGQFLDARANQLIAERIGRNLQVKSQDSENTLGDSIATKITSLNLRPDARAEVLKKIFQEQKTTALNQVIEEDPKRIGYFNKYIVAHASEIPAFLKPSVLKLVNQHLADTMKGQAPPLP